MVSEYTKKQEQKDGGRSRLVVELTNHTTLVLYFLQYEMTNILIFKAIFN